MRSKLGDLAETITRSPPFQDSAAMPLESTSVDDHLVKACQEAMTDLKLISEALLGSDREMAVRLQNARLTMKTIAERYLALRDKDALERRHHERAQ
jgi:hypothetical protein